MNTVLSIGSGISVVNSFELFILKGTFIVDALVLQMVYSLLLLLGRDVLQHVLRQIYLNQITKHIQLILVTRNRYRPLV